MQDVLIGILSVLLYTSGLLIWPACLLLWRKKRRRTTALRWVFLCEAVCQLVLIGFLVFSHGLVEHPYYWLILMIMVNLGFTPLAIVAAILDYASSSNTSGGKPA